MRGARAPAGSAGAIGPTGYRADMATRRQPPLDHRVRDASAPVEPAHREDPDGTAYDAVAEQEEARRARAERDLRLSSAERLERLHRLCAQLATLTPVRPPDRG